MVHRCWGVWWEWEGVGGPYDPITMVHRSWSVWWEWQGVGGP